MPNQLETLRTHALALIEALEVVEPEYRKLGLGAAFSRPAPASAPARSVTSGMRQGLDDLLTMASHLSGAQLRALAAELRTRHGIELDSLQQRRLRRLAAIRERGSIKSDDQYHLVRSRIDEIEALDTHTAECEALQRLTAAYELHHTKA